MDNTAYIYGINIEHTDGSRSLAHYVFDGKPTQEEQDMCIESLVPIYNKSYDEIRAAWFLYQTVDGTPAQFDDLFETVETDYGTETKQERIARIEAEADAEAELQMSAVSA